MNVRIAHADGRAYEVPEDAYDAMYKDAGFRITGLIYGGAVLADTEENRALAADPIDPNYSPLAEAFDKAAEVGYVNPANVDMGLVNEDGSPVMPEDNVVVNAPDDAETNEVVTSNKPGATVPVSSLANDTGPKVEAGMINPADKTD